MSMTSTGILNMRLAETPVAVIDFETTGMSPGVDRAVELAVVRIDPGSAPRLIFDTLINPCRPMGATFIHGITDADVRNAPKFEDILDELLPALSGCVIAAHNAAFDMRFLCFELGQQRDVGQLPFVCTRYCRPLIGRAPVSLATACIVDRIPAHPSHASRSDAVAAAHLWNRYQAEFSRLGLDTFESLTRLKKSYKFLKSFRSSPIDCQFSSAGESKLRPRSPQRTSR